MTKVVAVALALALIAIALVPLFKTDVSSGIIFSKGQIARVIVGPTNVPYASFRVGDYGTDYLETDELHYSKRYFSFYVYDNVLKTETHIFDTLPGQFALTSVIDENFYYSSNWEKDYGGWADTVAHGSYSVHAGNYHIQVDHPFKALSELNTVMQVFADLGYFVFPAYVNGEYFIRINQYFSIDEALKEVEDIENAYQAAIDELNKKEEEDNSSLPSDDSSSPDSSDIPSSDVPSSDTPSSDLPSSDVPSSDVSSSDVPSSNIPSSEVTSEPSQDSSDSEPSDSSVTESSSETVESSDVASSEVSSSENGSQATSESDSSLQNGENSENSSENSSIFPTESEDIPSDVTTSVPADDVNTSVPEDPSSDVSSDSGESGDSSVNSSESTDSSSQEGSNDSSSELPPISSVPEEPKEPVYVYPEVTYSIAGGSDSGITVLDERSGEIYFEFDCTDKWLRVVPSVSGYVYHRVYSMTASGANRNLGRSYNGSLDIARVPDNDNMITTVNNVDLDSYLIGVLMREMGNSKNEALYEAYRTQAIVARTYAMRKILIENVHGRNKAFGGDICDGSHCQAYRGNTISATEMVSRAVTTTSKMVITVKNSQGNDTLIEAIYCASNGGYTLSNYQYWNTSLRSYLQQVEDTYENLDTATNGRWETRFSPEDLGKYINYLKVNKPSHFNLLRMYTHEGFITGKEYSNPERLSSSVGDVVKFYAEVVAPLGEIPLKLVFEDENGIKTYIQFGANIKSFMSAASGMGINGFESAVVKSPNFHIYYAFNDYYVTADGSPVLYEKRLDETYIVTANGVETIKQYPHDLKIVDASGIGYLPSKNYDYIVKGTGWGHGVGMSQEGAFGRSRAGHTADMIIKHYYTGVDITLIEE